MRVYAVHILVPFLLMSFNPFLSTSRVTAAPRRFLYNSLKTQVLHEKRKAPVDPHAPDGRDCSVWDERATTECDIPPHTTTITVHKPIIIQEGETFDCGFKRYQHSNKECNMNKEKGREDAVFILNEAATLKNCILGFSQESVTCLGTCHVENCHWLQICDEAISFQGKSLDSSVTQSSFSNGGNKALQFNGAGNIIVEKSCFNNVDIVYRSCGSNCKSSARRDVALNDISVLGINTLAGYNVNNGDKVIVKNPTGGNVRYMCRSYHQEARAEARILAEGFESMPGLSPKSF